MNYSVVESDLSLFDDLWANQIDFGLVGQIKKRLAVDQEGKHGLVKVISNRELRRKLFVLKDDRKHAWVIQLLVLDSLSLLAVLNFYPLGFHEV